MREKDGKKGSTETNIIVAINANIYARDCLSILSLKHKSQLVSNRLLLCCYKTIHYCFSLAHTLHSLK